MGVGGQRHASSALPPGKTQYPLYRRLGGTQGQSGRVRDISLTGIRSPDRPTDGESLYQLTYPCPRFGCCTECLDQRFRNQILRDKTDNFECRFKH